MKPYGTFMSSIAYFARNGARIKGLVSAFHQGLPSGNERTNALTRHGRCGAWAPSMPLFLIVNGWPVSPTTQKSGLIGGVSAVRHSVPGQEGAFATTAPKV